MRWFLLLTLIFCNGCAYYLQTSKNPYLKELGIRRIYIEPIQNQTYKAGVESLVYNALVKKISANGQVQLVTDSRRADAVLSGAVNGADLQAAEAVPSNNIQPFDQGHDRIALTTTYSVNLTASFSLSLSKKKDREPKELWNRSFQRSRNFTSSTQLGVAGTTSTLINDSKYTQALADAADSMMGDLHESMLTTF